MKSKENLRVLLVTSRPLSHSAGLGKDIRDALERLGCQVDTMTTEDYVEDSDNDMLPIKYKQSRKCRLLRFFDRFAKRRRRFDYISNNGVLIVTPVEKKPLKKFLPGTLTYSIGGFGCNMICLHCQNYMISHEYGDYSRGVKITPEAIVENALKYDCKSIAWTYNEPTIHLPFNKKTSLLAKQKNLKVIYVSNGYFSNKSLQEVLGFVDAFNIDLKSMSDDFYKKVCGADLDVILDNLRSIYLAGKHLEITNLIINDYNDSVDEINALCDFVVNELDENVPVHFSRAFPYYKMNDISPTNPEILFKAKEIAMDKGIKNVYLGNI